MTSPSLTRAATTKRKSLEQTPTCRLATSEPSTITLSRHNIIVRCHQETVHCHSPVSCHLTHRQTSDQHRMPNIPPEEGWEGILSREAKIKEGAWSQQRNEDRVARLSLRGKSTSFGKIHFPYVTTSSARGAQLPPCWRPP
ncbi:hypothetical protein GOP47_0030494 [Adiantum capillus-veneris]|nr:hypothetical protein GOP47_0030494 [Adiantum capillus-veneris]